MPKKRAKNLTYKGHMIVGIHKLCPYETKIEIEHSRKTIGDKVIIAYRRDLCDTKITHEVHFSGNGFQKSNDNLHDPSQDVILTVWFKAASAIDRPSGSKCIIHGDNIYYVMTWTDVLENHSKECELKRQRDNRMIYYLRKLENEDHKKLIFELITNEKLL